MATQYQYNTNAMSDGCIRFYTADFPTMYEIDTTPIQVENYHVPDVRTDIQTMSWENSLSVLMSCHGA